jgi:hypothetical protein
VAKKLLEIPSDSRILTFNYDTGERYLSVDLLFEWETAQIAASNEKVVLA